MGDDGFIENETKKLKLGWVVKDQDGNFARINSIKKSDNKWLYISFKNFSPECRGYISKSQAQITLDELNKMNDISEFDITFHLEYQDLYLLSDLYNSFTGDNLIIREKPLARQVFNKVI